MSEIPRARLILPDYITRDEFRAIASTHGWLEHQVYDSPGTTYEEVWTNINHTAALHYVEDGRFSGERFLLIRGDSIQSMMPAISQAFHTVSFNELYKIIVHGANIDEQIRALTRLGIIAFEVTDDVRVAWETGLFHPEERVRLSTIRAMSFVADPKVIPLLEEAALEDPSENVRSLAQRLIESIRRHHEKPLPRTFPFGLDGT